MSCSLSLVVFSRGLGGVQSPDDLCYLYLGHQSSGN